MSKYSLMSTQILSHLVLNVKMQKNAEYLVSFSSLTSVQIKTC